MRAIIVSFIFFVFVFIDVEHGYSAAVAGRRTPTVIVVKCGTEAEAAREKKPGNRGKRDSQLILMNFFSRVTYNDRMTPLDFDLFRKIHVLTGVTPDFFEVCLMVNEFPPRLNNDFVKKILFRLMLIRKHILIL